MSNKNCLHVSGTSYCEEPSEYSDCAKEQTIVDGCSSHLDYMRAKNPSEMSTMQRISDLKDPMALLEKVQFSNLCKWVNSSPMRVETVV